MELTSTHVLQFECTDSSDEAQLEVARGQVPSLHPRGAGSAHADGCGAQKPFSRKDDDAGGGAAVAPNPLSGDNTPPTPTHGLESTPKKRFKCRTSTWLSIFLLAFNIRTFAATVSSSRTHAALARPLAHAVLPLLWWFHYAYRL